MEAQNAISVSGVQPQWLLLHISPVPVQLPQLVTVRAAPQLSVPVNDPHWALLREQNVWLVSGAQLHWLGTVAPHVWGAVQVPQL